MSSPWACTLWSRSSLRCSEQVDLPQVLGARVDEWFQCAHAGSADAPLEIANLLELRRQRRIRLGLESGLAHEQHPLSPYPELGPQSEQTHHVDNHLRRETLPQILQIKTHWCVRYLTGAHHTQQLLVGVETRAEPASCLALALVEKKHEDVREYQHDERRREQRRDQESIVQRVQHDCDCQRGKHQLRPERRRTIVKRARYHCKDRRGAAVHQRGSESADDPRSEERRVGKECR